jgi:PAS domain S-box-containing protein
VVAADGVDDAAVLDALFDKSPQGLFVLDSDLRVVRYNPSGRGVRALPAEAVIGHTVEDFAPGLGPDILSALADDVLTRGEPLRGRRVQGPSPSDPQRTLTLEVSAFPLRGRGGAPGLVAVVEDVTDKQAAADRLAVLSAVHASVGSTLDLATTAEELVDALSPAFADAASVDLLDDSFAGGRRHAGPVMSDVPLRRMAYAPGEVETDRQQGESRPLPFPTPFTQALSDGQARLVQVSPEAPWVAADADGFAPLLHANVHSMIVAPLMARDTALGLLTLYRHRIDLFDEADLDVARQVASTASAHLDNAHSYRREHRVASALQRRLQPLKVPNLSAVETAHAYLPESAGGDWFDVIALSGTRVALVAGHVHGHGIEAAATMGQLRIALRALALQDLEADELLTRLDEIAVQIADAAGSSPDAPYVATCAVTVYDPISCRSAMARAGHPAPVIVQPDGTPLDVDVPQGPPLGAGDRGTFTPAIVHLQPGSLIAHYTEGLLTSGGGDRTSSRRRLVDILAPASSGNLQELCDAAVYHLAPSADDDTVLLLARTRTLAAEDVADWTLPADPQVVATARRLVGQQLSAWGLDDAAYTTELLVSELVTNAIRHGKGPIRLRLIRDQDRLLSEVTDASSSSPHLRQARETDEGGRGLYLVMHLSSRWGVRHSADDKTIWSEQRLGAEPEGEKHRSDGRGATDPTAQ